MNKSFFSFLVNKEKATQKYQKNWKARKKRVTETVLSALLEKGRDPQKNYIKYYISLYFSSKNEPCFLKKVFKLYLLPHVLLRSFLIGVILKYT